VGVERDDLTRLIAEVRTDDAVRARARERSLRQQATEEATLAGVLLDLAEEQAEVTLRTRSDRLAQGRLIAVGTDFVVLRSGATSDLLVAVAAISTVRRRPGERAPDTTGRRPPPPARSLAAHIASLAPERPRVTLTLGGEPGSLVGELRSAGLDVLTVLLDGHPPVTAYLALDSLESLSVSPPG
jgi:hypothetical protein